MNIALIYFDDSDSACGKVGAAIATVISQRIRRYLSDLYMKKKFPPKADEWRMRGKLHETAQLVKAGWDAVFHYSNRPSGDHRRYCTWCDSGKEA